MIQGQELVTNIIDTGQEEAHAFRINQGLVESDNVNDWNNSDNFNLIKLHITKVLENEEIQAIHIENIIRAQIDPTGRKIKLRENITSKNFLEVIY